MNDWVLSVYWFNVWRTRVRKAKDSDICNEDWSRVSAMAYVQHLCYLSQLMADAEFRKIRECSLWGKKA